MRATYYVRIGSLSIAKALHEFIEQTAVPGTSLSAEAFWSGFAELLRECGARNRQLLQVATSSSPASINIIVSAPASRLIRATTRISA